MFTICDSILRINCLENIPKSPFLCVFYLYLLNMLKFVSAIEYLTGIHIHLALDFYILMFYLTCEINCLK